MVDLRKELEKIKEKQDKVNYLQRLYKKTKDKKLRDEILHILDEILEQESLEEVVEPVRIRHELLEDVRRETSIVQSTPEVEQSTRVPNIPLRRREEDQEEQLVTYERPPKSSEESLYETGTPYITLTPLPMGGIPRERPFLTTSADKLPVSYEGSEGRGIPIEANRREYIGHSDRPLKEYIPKPIESPEEREKTQPFSIETLLRRRSTAKRDPEKMKEEEVAW